MGQFFKFVLATVVGLLLFFFIGFIILIGIAASASSDNEVSVEENSVLELKLDKPIEERKTKDPFDGTGFPMMGGNNLGLQEIKDAIRKAKSDDNIRGIYLDVSRVEAGMATLEEIRNELLNFKKSGKFVVAYNDLCSEKSYYLTSVADKIYLNPAGTLEFNGLSAELLFFKGMLEKLEVQPYIFKVGEFKSAVEPFFLDKMSEPNRLQTTAFLNSLNRFTLENIAKSRKIPMERLTVISDSMLVHNADDALKYGLVTDLAYYDQALDFMKKKTGTKNKEELNLVTLNKYEKVAEDNDGETARNKIAVIYAQGDIVDGDGDEDNIGGNKYAEAIRKARLDDKVKAVVLRINSGGGSALASDVMWREVMLTKKVKPVIASMGDVAASGGYYMAMACDTIVAHPNTITGSIGVFGVMANFEDFLRNKLGVTVDRVKTGKFSDMPTVTRDLTDYEKQNIQQEVQRIYDDFTSKAAKGRKLPLPELQKVASGRVWSGIEAKEHGLVDVYGGLDDAITLAAKRANLKTGDYRVRRLPAQKGFFEQLMTNFNTEARTSLLQAELGENYKYFEMVQKVKNLKGIQAKLPFDFSIQ